MRALFAATLFVGAALLFLVQPLLARMVLPLLGGAPAVWNTCMVFFQAALLAGYAYAHAAPAWLGVRRHAVIHLLLLTATLGLVPLLLLPLRLPGWWPQPDDFHPILWLILLLLATAGLPFAVVSTTSPLLQRWFTHTAAPAGRDPYFLYGASNLGSILGLMAYPFLLEPTLTLPHQCWLWAGGYVLLIGLSTACAVCLWRAPADPSRDHRSRDRKGAVAANDRSLTVAAPMVAALTAIRRLRWVLLAFTPSSLMLSVTAYLSTDVAAVPLLWVAPLTLYLLTFVLAFAPAAVLPANPHALDAAGGAAGRADAPVAGDGAAGPAPHRRSPFGPVLDRPCLSRRAGPRPSAGRTAHRVLFLAVGRRRPRRHVQRPRGAAVVSGRVGISDRAGAGVPVAAGAGVRPAEAEAWRGAPLDWLLPAALLIGTSALVFGVQALGIEPGPLSIALMFAAPLVVCYLFLFRPLRFGLGVAALLLAGSLYHGEYGKVELRLRSFFAVHRVTVDPTGHFRQLVHGDTVHGRQSLLPGEEREPLTYYHRSGPIGQAFAALDYNDPEKRDPRLKRVGVVGLGAGSLCCYARHGEEWTFYEIDPAVRYIACDSGLFTFYPDCPARKSVVLGDARLSLERSQQRFGLLVIDAFGSDAIPVHLLTREAMRVYLDHLDDDGISAFNISNRYLDLQTVLADLARDSGPLVCYVEDDRDAPKESGKSPSQWVVVARDRAALARVLAGGDWRTAPPRDGTASWSDDFSNLIGALKWNDFGQE